MKKVLIIVCSIILVVAVCFGTKMNKIESSKNENYLRIHIRANSNESVDQSVKYLVKDAIIDYLTPIVAEETTIQGARDKVLSNMSSIEEIANCVLASNNFNYRAKARINEEFFPDRSYNDFFLENGVYEALIVDLGSGTGNNWWCVVFPPLCFVNAEYSGEEKIEYRSKLMEIINKFK